MPSFIKILISPTLKRLSEDLTRVDLLLKSCPHDDFATFNSLYFERARIVQTFGEICAYGDMSSDFPDSNEDFRSKII